MDRNHAFSMALAAATLGLTACGGNDIAPGAPTPAAVACTAPDALELSASSSVNSHYASVCFPATSGGGSSRYDLIPYGCGPQVYRVDFANSTCAAPSSNTEQVFASWSISPTTTTVGGIAADGITPVTGSGRTVTVSSISGSGEFISSTPLITTGTYVLCKTTPASTTTNRLLPYFSGYSSSPDSNMTPTFVLRSSAVGTTTINTQFGFDGGTFQRFYD